jgi:choloylglycine hydrolase
MCTAINVKLNDTYFGRNLDLDYKFDAKIIIVPRNFKISFKKEESIYSHYAMMGVGTVIDNYPLFADAINEKGLSIAGLNFPFNAKYYEYKNNKKNLATYELVLYLLATCKNIKDVKEELKKINILDEDFSNEIKLTPLHFLISDKESSLVVESTQKGMEIYDNKYNILTNNPPFNFQLEYLSNFDKLTNQSLDPSTISLSSKHFYSYGSGGYGLPGDYSSASRFIKANFVKKYLVPSNKELENVRSFFSVLDSVYMPYGSIKTMIGYEHTRYTDCYNSTRGILYYKTYENPNINEILMSNYNLDGSSLTTVDFNLNFNPLC